VKRLIVLIGMALFSLAACAVTDASRKQASYHFQMGLSYLGENDATRALIELAEAEKLTPNDPAVLNSLGLAYFYKKRYDLAELKYRRAIELKPDYSEARNNLGVNYLEMQRWDDAVAQFTLVLADLFFINHEDARINLGLANLGKGDYPQALAILRQSVATSPQNIIARVGLGRVYFAMGRNDLAIQEFTKAIELNRNYQNGYYYLALAHLKGKDYVSAADAFREAIRIAPDSEKGRLSREYLESMR
jgi:Tfp pilus assembly protein PilF